MQWLSSVVSFEALQFILDFAPAKFVTTVFFDLMSLRRSLDVLCGGLRARYVGGAFVFLLSSSAGCDFSAVRLLLFDFPRFV